MGYMHYVAWCANEKNVIGFQLRQEKNQKGGDDTAANNLKMFCEDGSVLITEWFTDSMGYSNKLENPPTWGDWTERKNCPSGQVICGFRVQIEPPQGTGTGDDTALNNIDFECCQK